MSWMTRGQSSAIMARSARASFSAYARFAPRFASSAAFSLPTSDRPKKPLACMEPSSFM
jgi:hypothetical protein